MDSPRRDAPLCLVTGVGDATGSAIVRRFWSAGYRVAMIARNGRRLDALAQEMPGCTAHALDLSDLDALDRTVKMIQQQEGEIHVLIHNAVSHSFGRFTELPPEELESNFRVNVTALLHLARLVTPAMISRAAGSIIVTGNTAAYRGVPDYALFAPSKSAQRILCQSLARDLGPRKVHVGYVAVDGAIDVTWLGETDEDRPSWLVPPADWPWAREDFFVDTDAIAEEVHHMAHQHPTAWSFETVLRPFAEKW